MLCSGDASEYCGGGNRLNVYELLPAEEEESLFGAQAESVAEVTTTSTSSSATSTVSPTVVPTIKPLVSNTTFVAEGCFPETSLSAPSGIDAVNTTVEYNSLTPSYCGNYCADLAPGYTLSGVRNGTICSCFSSSSTTTALPLSFCSITGCKGANTTACGSPLNVLLYSASTNSTILAASTLTIYTTPSPANATSLGCFAPTSTSVASITHKKVLLPSFCACANGEVAQSSAECDGSSTVVSRWVGWAERKVLA